jgi:membrane-associated phospholipid phosphatase
MRVAANPFLLAATVYILTYLFFFGLYGELLSFSAFIFVVAGIFILLGCSSEAFKRFKYWSPFLVVLLCYEALRVLYEPVAHSRGVADLYTFDKLFWGYNLTGAFQTAMMSAPLTTFMTAVYSIHLPLILVTAVFLWYRGRAVWLRYTFAVLISTYLAFLTFLLIPSAPPWMSGAATNLLSGDSSHSLTGAYASLSGIVEADPLASFPSLHAVYVILFAYSMWSIKRTYGLLSLLLVGLVLFSTLYLGQHYTVDLIAGGLYAMVGVLSVEYLARREKSQVGGPNTSHRGESPTLDIRRLRRVQSGLFRFLLCLADTL